MGVRKLGIECDDEGTNANLAAESSETDKHVQSTGLSGQVTRANLFGDPCSSDPISQFPCVGSDPISQFSCSKRSGPEAPPDISFTCHLS